MKKILVLTFLAVFVCGAAFAQGASDKVKNLDAKVKKAVLARKVDTSNLEKNLDGSLLAFRREVANVKEPNFEMAFQSLVKVMDSYNDLRKVSQAAASAKSFDINVAFKAGWGEKLTVTQLINRESIVLFDSMQAEFNAWGAQLEKDLSTVVVAPAAQPLMAVLAQARKYVNNMKTYNVSHILQSLASVMDEHNDLRKLNPALAAQLSKEINKPIVPGFGGTLVISHVVHMESVFVFGDTQNEFDAWADAIEKDIK